MSIWLCGPCIAPFVLIGAVVVIGWNEKRAVCRAKALAQGRDAVVEVGCDDTSEAKGELVTFSCDLERNGLDPAELTVQSSLFEVGFPGTCLATSSEMLQCVEKKETISNRRRTPDTYHYTYSREWKAEETQDGNFRDSGRAADACGTSINPTWDTNVVPKSSTVYAKSAKAGAWTVTKFTSIACDVTLNSTYARLASTNVGWSTNNGKFSKGSGNTVGDFRVHFNGNDWSRPMVTGVGLNSDGTLTKWKASSGGWLGCDEENNILEVREGTFDRDSLFEMLEDENTVLTWILRVVGFAFCWLAFLCVLGPVVWAAEVAEFIPFVGDFISDGMEFIVVAVACLPGTACCLLVTGICWVAVRPLVGIPLLLIGCLCAGGGGFYFFKKQQEKQAGGGSSNADDPSSAMAYGAPAQPVNPYAQPCPPPQMQFAPMGQPYAQPYAQPYPQQGMPMGEVALGPQQLGQPYAQQPYAQQPYAQQPYAQQPYAQQPYAQQPYAQPYQQ